MKCTIPEISWHNREPVLSVDIHPISNVIYKLASGGGDSHILLWNMCLCENGSVKQEVVSDLTRHQRSVNSVRWSPSGNYLASADDDANIIVWQLKTDNIPLLENNNDDKETWIVYKIFRGHKEDIYDLCWSVDNSKLLSGSIDNTSIVWDLSKGKMDHIMTDHKGFVQGVAWDPKNQILATISTDRMCRIFDISGKQVKARIYKGKLPLPIDHCLYDKESKYFHDDTFKSFFRRLQFSPDGSLLVVPSGYFHVDDSKRAIHCTLVFTMDNWTEPAAVLPLDGQSSTVVRFCPLLFQQRENGPEPSIKLPYRMIFAVGTDHDIILYDTQQPKPFARFHEIHYTRITDLTWSSDGLLLVASSTDGFCTLITFEKEELGILYEKDDIEEEDEEEEITLDVEVTEKDENIDITNKKEEIKKRPSFIQQWVQNTQKKVKTEKLDKENGENNKKLIPRRITPKRVEDNNKIDVKSKIIDKKEEINRLVPRRIVPIRVEDTKPTELVVLLENSKEIKTRIEKIDETPTDDNKKNTESNKEKLTKKPNVVPSKKPTKSNPLLEFLKRSGEKKKTTKQNVKIDLTLVEDEARDGFDTKGGKVCEGDVVVLDEDRTEDFCLQLEDTREDRRETDKGSGEIDGVGSVEENKEINRIIEIKDDSCSPPQKKTVDIIIEKKPRRVPLITLTSPKGKKKPPTSTNKTE
ncbi:uncharacterized protein LOC130894897 [Diorhabda carinulata]|uniref:uncharacterized protein LOC130894897 n=1 Tax=Diorhabda carinulata TaxID=1163345 RepID=UPI0025A23013|nr:uncharacterized protein LOC130894897 [Diorhabda carinulata]